jgi:4-hydroxybenzoate polyprenyltransferase
VAVMLALFSLLGMAFHNGFRSYHPSYLFAVLALVSSYVSATSFNDLADEGIDKVNHKGKPGRLLVTGEATRGQLARVGLFASASMLVCGWIISPLAFWLMLASLALNVAYSLPPLKLSYRTFMVPFVLAMGYVVVPYNLGLVLADARFTNSDVGLLGGLYLLFLARINLKDFRDRAGDAAFGKPTLLLSYGKKVTVLASQAMLWLGTLVTISATWEYGSAVLCILIYAGVISYLLHLLYRANVGPKELVIIGVAAKVGNGLLLSLLAIFFLSFNLAPPWVIALVLALLFAGSVANVKFLYHDPRSVLESYRG